jgi:hypothetical protein
MVINNNFIVNYCYYGIREKIVTHITNVLELARYLEKTPQEIEKYFAFRLNTHTELEYKTLKIKGLLSKPIIDRIIDELLSEKTE